MVLIQIFLIKKLYSARRKQNNRTIHIKKTDKDPSSLQVCTVIINITDRTATDPNVVSEYNYWLQRLMIPISSTILI